MAKRKILTIVLVSAVVVAVGVGVLVWMDYQDNQSGSISGKDCRTYSGTTGRQCVEEYIELPVNKAVEKSNSNQMTPVILIKNGQVQSVSSKKGPAIYFETNDDIVTNAYFEQAYSAE